MRHHIHESLNGQTFGSKKMLISSSDNYFKFVTQDGARMDPGLRYAPPRLRVFDAKNLFIYS